MTNSCNIKTYLFHPISAHTLDDWPHIYLFNADNYDDACKQVLKKELNDASASEQFDSYGQCYEIFDTLFDWVTLTMTEKGIKFNFNDKCEKTKGYKKLKKYFKIFNNTKFNDAKDAKDAKDARDEWSYSEFVSNIQDFNQFLVDKGMTEDPHVQYSWVVKEITDYYKDKEYVHVRYINGEPQYTFSNTCELPLDDPFVMIEDNQDYYCTFKINGHPSGGAIATYVGTYATYDENDEMNDNRDYQLSMCLRGLNILA